LIEEIFIWPASKEFYKLKTLLILEDNLLREELIKRWNSDNWIDNQMASYFLTEIQQTRQDEVLALLLNSLELYKSNTTPHNSLVRNTFKLLETAHIPEEYQGRVINACEQCLKNSQEPVANKVYAMSTFYNICKDLPELGYELSILIQDQMPFAQKGFVSRASKILKILSK